MSKHIYHLPLQKIHTFIQEHQEDLKSSLNDSHIYEYHKTLGKAYYLLEIERFIKDFKIDKNINLALKNIKYFSSEVFLNHLYTLLELKIKNRDVFYCFVYILKTKDEKLFESFCSKIFLHFYTSINLNSNINIDYIDLAKTIAKNKSINIKESFGKQEDDKNYFKILLDDKIEVFLLDGGEKSIKTLRKKAYKRILSKLLD